MRAIKAGSCAIFGRIMGSRDLIEGKKEGEIDTPSVKEKKHVCTS